MSGPMMGEQKLGEGARELPLGLTLVIAVGDNLTAHLMRAAIIGPIAMSRMLFVTLTLICALSVKAEVLTLSCDGTMKAEEEQAKPQAITKMGLIVNFDAGVVTGFTGITARIDEVNANSIAFKGTTTHPSAAEWSVRGSIDRSRARWVRPLPGSIREVTTS